MFQKAFTHVRLCRQSKVAADLLTSHRWSSCDSILFRTMASGSDDKDRHSNRLALEKSPYLLQHAGNPVDWYPWGIEAFNKAQTENKPIFLSVGYSTCHWCHVMERESFENAEIGQIMSENFVCIKVDREERPDVDKVYMTFVQATSGRGGWPMSVWLTPDLKPFVGGTYFPPDDRYYGSPGFKTVLRSISKQWKTNQEKIVEQGSAILAVLSEGSSMSEEGRDLPGPETADTCCSMLEKSFDPDFGGFGKAPKFPHPANFNFLFRAYANKPSSEAGKKALHMALFTLRMMARGGMHDHVAQGFHRYSTDKFWHVPHFEKMLYDQGQLAVSYTDALQVSRDKLYSDITRDILKYVSRDLSDPSGGFYSAEDADSHPSHGAEEKTEGAFCVWTFEEIQTLLSENVDGRPDLTMSQVFSEHFDVKADGNVAPFQDPHDELKNKNVLIVKGSLKKTADHFKLTPPAVTDVLEKSLQILFVQRQERPKPHLDDKMVAAWNGLMLSGFARAGQVLGDPEYVSRAEELANFLRCHMYQSDKGTLLRTCYAGKDKTVTQIAEPIKGFADDYTFIIRGLLDLYEACYDEQWIKWAESLQEKQDDLFWDEVGGAYFSTAAGDPNIVLRMKEEQDGAEPSANSVSAGNLLRLAGFLDRPLWREQAARIFNVFSERMTKIPIAMPELVAALMLLRETPKQIIVVGDKSEADTQALLRCVHSSFLPNKVLILSDGKPDSFLASRLKILMSLEKKDGKATAYVCENYTCSLPVNSVDELQKVLTQPNPHSEL